MHNSEVVVIYVYFVFCLSINDYWWGDAVNVLYLNSFTANSVLKIKRTVD